MYYYLKLRYYIVYDLVKITLLSLRIFMFNYFINIINIYFNIKLNDELYVFILFVYSFVLNVLNVINLINFYDYFITFKS